MRHPSRKHREGVKDFADEVSALAGGLERFNAHRAREDVYALLCEYLKPRISRLHLEVSASTAPPCATPPCAIE